jgi:ribosomal protein L29
MKGENLRGEILESKKKLLSLRIKKSSGDLKDNSIFRKTRKTIARLFTKLNNNQD